MDVDSGLWWSVWWPWVAVIVAGVIALAVAVHSFVRAWRARHLLVNALDKAGDLPQVNQAERSVRRNAVLEQHKSKQLTPDQLRALRSFVLVEGDFQCCWARNTRSRTGLTACAWAGRCPGRTAN